MKTFHHAVVLIHDFLIPCITSLGNIKLTLLQRKNFAGGQNRFFEAGNTPTCLERSALIKITQVGALAACFNQNNKGGHNACRRK